MSYRDPGALKYVNFRTPQSKGLEKSYADINTELAKQAALNEKSNWAIQVKNNLANAEAQATIGTTISKNASFVDQQSLNNGMSKSLDLYYESKTRMEQSTGPYQKVDEEGNLVYSYENDNQIIKDYGKFIQDFPQQLAALQYVQQNFSSVGTGEGQVLASNLDPYMNLLMKIDDPNYDGVNVRYDIDQDPNGAPMMGITIYGSEVEKLNKQQGKGDKDAYTIEPGMLAAQLNNANGNPNDFTAYQLNGKYVSEIKKGLETTGMTKNGEIDSSFRISGGRSSKVLQNGFTQFYDESYLNNSKIDQFVNPKVKAQVSTAANYGNTSLSTLIRQYADRDNDGNYYVDPLEWDQSQQRYIKNQANRIDFGDGTSSLNYDPANESLSKTSGFPANIIANAEQLVKTRALEGINANMAPIQTPFGQPKAPKEPKVPTPIKKTEGEVKRENTKTIIDKVVADLDRFEIEGAGIGKQAIKNLGLGKEGVVDTKTFEANKSQIRAEVIELTEQAKEDQVQSIVNELNNIGGKGSYEYNQKTQKIIKLGPAKYDPKTKAMGTPPTLVEIATPLDFSDKTSFDKFKQELYNLVNLGVVEEETTSDDPLGLGI